MASPDILDLAEAGAPVNRALVDLRKNLSHFLISSTDDPGPEIEFGDIVLKFKSKIPATAMAYLVSDEHDRIDALRGYIRLCLVPASRNDFEEILDDVPLEALNAIVEHISEVATSFPTK